MARFTLVTSNIHKIAEYKRLLPKTIKFDIQKLDLEELQSLDLEIIVKHKVVEAYKKIGSPIVVEDVSAGIDKLGGLPGPFVKFFEQAIGPDALYVLGGDGAKATLTCTIGYYDGIHLFLCSGILKGKIKELSPNQGFGFDRVFVPGDACDKTFADMTFQEKDKISHRKLAIDKLIRYLQ
jgi:non-canonical purine NTP pyrophosphatase (RdgB/HAM1 family)